LRNFIDESDSRRDCSAFSGPGLAAARGSFARQPPESPIMSGPARHRCVKITGRPFWCALSMSLPKSAANRDPARLRRRKFQPTLDWSRRIGSGCVSPAEPRSMTVDDDQRRALAKPCARSGVKKARPPLNTLLDRVR
jgi:hypothetical protein